MNYEVKFTTKGRGGWVYYIEDGKTLPFDWDITTAGFDIYVPTSEEWTAFCDGHNALQAKDRREEILQRIAEEVRKQKAKTAKVSIDETGISFSFESNWVHRLLNKILGV
jgi:hypothetical protein